MTSLTVMFSSSLSPGLRGAVAKWMLEPMPGMYVARLSERVRSELWQSVADWTWSNEDAYAAMISPAATDQGFTVVTAGFHSYDVEDALGIKLIFRRKKTRGGSVEDDDFVPDW